MNSIFAFLIILLSATVSFGQKYKDVISIQIKDTLVNVLDQKLSIQLNCRNESDSTLLLYGFNKFSPSPVSIDRLRDYEGKMSAWTAIFIYDSLMRRVKASGVPKNIHYQPITKEKLDSIISNSRTDYLKKTEVIKGYGALMLRIEIDLNAYKLEKGTYYLQLVYFSGKGLSKMVEFEQMNSDKNKYGAFIFRGIAVSNKIRLKI